MKTDMMKPTWRCSTCGADCETDWAREAGPAPVLYTLTRVTVCEKCGRLPVKTPKPARKEAGE